MISATTVERTWQKMPQISREDAPRLIGESERKQPFLQAHLMTTSTALFNPEVGQLYFYLGVVVYQIMKQGKRRVRLVSEEIMQAVEDAQGDVLELLEEDTDADFVSAATSMAVNHPEPEVLRYIVEALMEDDADIDISEDDKGILFLELQKVLDALILSRDWYLKQKQT